MSEDDARREVRRAVDAKGGRVRFARDAGIDPGTLGDFLKGKHWPSARSRTRLEEQLGWPLGRIEDLRLGLAVDATPADEDDVIYVSIDRDAVDPTRQIIELIRAHPGLHPVTKDHLAKQIEILALVPLDLPLAPHRVDPDQVAVDAQLRGEVRGAFPAPEPKRKGKS